MVKSTALERIRQLEAEKKSILEEAKTELFEQIGSAINGLADIGLYYKVVETEQKSTPNKRMKTGKARSCPLCQFDTVPPHDGRTHRSQSTKKAFSEAELKDLGMTKAP